MNDGMDGAKYRFFKVGLGMFEIGGMFSQKRSYLEVGFPFNCWIWNVKIEDGKQTLNAISNVRRILGAKFFGHRNKCQVEVFRVVAVHFARQRVLAWPWLGGKRRETDGKHNWSSGTELEAEFGGSDKVCCEVNKRRFIR